MLQRIIKVGQISKFSQFSKNTSILNVTSIARYSSQQGEVSKCPVKGLVLGLYEKEGDKPPKLTSIGEKFDDRTHGKIHSLIQETNINGVLGKGKVFQNVDPEFHSVAIIGLGPEGAEYDSEEVIEEGMENARICAGIGARELQLLGCTEVHVDAMEYPEQVAEGASISVYRYQDNKKKKKRMIIPQLCLFESPEVDAWTRGLFKGEAQNLARKLSDAPANQMTPTAFAQAAVDALCPCGVTVEVRTINWIEANHLNSFLMVAKGSCEPPVFLEISYCGTSPEDKPVLLVGKGITFDSGGLSLRAKPLNIYRGSMAGAAVVVAAVRAAAALSLPINIAAIIPLCENMPSGLCCKPGDVVTCLNTKTLAIEECDRIGVIAMADPLVYGQNTHKPRLVLDVGTMANGVRSAFAGAACGVFSNSNEIWEGFKKAGILTGDRMWRMPLWNYYRNLVAQNMAFDISNRGWGPASSCIAAAVLHQFVPCIDWAHLDITGVGMLAEEGCVPYLLPHRMTGRPTRTLIQFLYQTACPEEIKQGPC
ncbi:cytosol aminopeptidase-like [Eupeodes corollae]|uniref:cytosol aminopeptidase-like n=1 Tax=Eupeodes corollae TaxID=290404 RepID=UPI0024916C64|nr:cytosol aminopeptidase-like [Eupeodes corollae]